MKSFLSTLGLAAILASATLGATHSPASHKTAPHAASRLVIIRMDSDFRPHTRSEYGKLSGYDAVEAHVRMGDRIQFVNPDDENHTATGLSYSGQQFPAHYTFQGDFTRQHGRIIDASEWSTGTVRAHGGKSQIFVAKRVGHYFYACGYHMAQNMRGVIVVGT